MMESDAVKIMAHTFEKLKTNENFVAYYLIKYQEKYRLPKESICKLLKMEDISQYYSLGLTKFPKFIQNPQGISDTFKYRIIVIAEYVKCDSFVLEGILSNV